MSNVETFYNVVDDVFTGANPKWIEQQQALASLWPLGEEGIAKAFSMV